MTKKINQTTIRLSDETKKVLKKLMDRLETSQSQTIRLGLLRLEEEWFPQNKAKD